MEEVVQKMDQVPASSKPHDGQLSADFGYLANRRDGEQLPLLQSFHIDKSLRLPEALATPKYGRF